MPLAALALAIGVGVVGLWHAGRSTPGLPAASAPDPEEVRLDSVRQALRAPRPADALQSCIHRRLDGRVVAVERVARWVDGTFGVQEADEEAAGPGGLSRRTERHVVDGAGRLQGTRVAMTSEDGQRLEFEAVLAADGNAFVLADGRRVSLAPGEHPTTRLGEQALLGALARGEAESVTVVTLQIPPAGQPTVSRTTYAAVQRTGTRVRCQVATEQGPVGEMVLELSPDQTLVGAEMASGSHRLRIDMQPAEDAAPTWLPLDRPLVPTIVELQSLQPGTRRLLVPARVLEALPADDFQHAEEGALVVTDASGISDRHPPPWCLDPAPGIESDHPDVVRWATTNKLDHPATPSGRIGAAVHAVSAHLSIGRHLSGNASARTALAQGYGDCTEVSHLLCAVLRALSVPARVDVGLVARQGGGWAAHAWVSAFDANTRRWVHVDPVFPQAQRSGYIRISRDGELMEDAVRRLLMLAAQMEPAR